MKLTLDIPNEQLFNQIVWFLKRFKNDGLEMDTTYKSYDTTASSSQNILDLSTYHIDSFKTLDGLEFQTKIRDEW